jgi:hypothetical protein
MCREGEKTEVLYNIVQIPGAMNNTMNFNDFATNQVEYEIGFNDKDSITRILEFFVTWYMTEEGVCFEVADTLIEFFNKGCRICWTVICDPVEY